MFTTYIGESVGFAPEASEEKSVKTNSSQTEIPRNKERMCQIPEKKNAEAQTDKIERKGDIYVEFDAETLSDFLSSVTPYVCSVLEKNVKSHAFDQYDSSDRGDVAVSCQHVLDRSLPNEFSCPSVSWNSVGTAIAVAYSSNNHLNWCEHDSSVGIWSLSRKNIDDKKPNIILETDCCITRVSFHPELPAVLVAGKFNGEIVLWNISKEDDPILGTSEATFGNHREPITGLHWLSTNNTHENIEFVSCSLDGKILLWRLEKNVLVPYDGFIILTEHLSRSFSIKANKENAEVGVISMSINHEDQSIFIIGIEGGGIVQGSFNSSAPASYTGLSSIPLRNPITMNFERHKGQVTAVLFSSFSRNIFLSAGSDGEVRIYTLLQPKPLKIFQLPNGGINSAEWSPMRPLVFSCVCSSGQLHIWDLTQNEVSPIKSFSLDSGDGGGLHLEYNKQNKSLMATSTTNGKVQVWLLPEALLKPLVDERKKLQDMAKSTD